MKTLIAIMLGLGLIFVGSGQAFAVTVPNTYCDLSDCKSKSMDQKVNKSIYIDFPKRQQHASGWYNSKVCGMEICSGKTGSESYTYQGMTQSGAKQIITHNGFDGKYFIKGNFK